MPVGDNKASIRRRLRHESLLIRALLALLLLVVLGFVILRTVAPDYRIFPAKLEVIGSPAPDGLKIMVVGPRNQTSQMLDGVSLAVKEINAEAGINGRPLEIVAAYEKAYDGEEELERSVTRARELAYHLSRQKDVLAVIGHTSSDFAIPASSLYDRYGILYLSTDATATALTRHGFDTLFALQPSNASIAQAIANYALAQGIRRFVILSDNSSYARELTSFFKNWVTQSEGILLFEGLITSERKSIASLMLYLLDNDLFKPEEVDAIFAVSASIEDMADVISTARELGLEMPILGSELIFSSELASLTGAEQMKGVAGVSLYDGSNTAPETQSFINAFEKEYKMTPDLSGAIGYDAVKLIQHVVSRLEGKTDARSIADRIRMMRYVDPYVGATGRMVFNVQGRVTDTDVFIVRHDGKEFRTIDRYRLPLAAVQAADPTELPQMQ